MFKPSLPCPCSSMSCPSLLAYYLPSTQYRLACFLYRIRELFQVLEGLFPPRIPPPDRVSASTSSSPTQQRRRPVYLPKVTPGQRAILDFLREELSSGWQLALPLLAKYSVSEAVGVRGNGGGVSHGPSLGGVVTVECMKETALTLSSLMKDRVPNKDRALALEGLLQEASAVVHCSDAVLCYVVLHCTIFTLVW